jgi:hypothetical protein
MRFRVTLTNPTEGSLILTREPKGLSDIYPTIKRGENHGLTTETDVKLEFYCNGAGKEFIDLVRLEQGIDAEITINIEAFCGCEGITDAPDYSIDYSDDYGSFIGGSCDDDFTGFYEGLLDLKTWSTDDIFTKVNINPAGILQTVKNRLDTKVDLFASETLEGTALTPFTYGGYDLTLHSRALKLVSQAEGISESYSEVIVAVPSTDTIYFSLPFDYITYDEIGGIFIGSTPFVSSIQSPPALIQPVFVNNSAEDLVMQFDYTFIGTLYDYLAYARNYNLKLVYKVDTVLTGDNIPVPPLIPPTEIIDYGNKNILANIIMTQAINEVGTLNLTMPAGSMLTFYFVFANYDNDPVFGPFITGIDLDVTQMTVTGTTISETDPTTAKAFAIFEAGAQISRVITDQLDSFRSNIFGRTNSEPYAYDANGCGSFTALTNGFMIRGYPTTGDLARSIRISMNEFFNGLNPVWNLGLGIEKDGDDYFIVMDSKDTFYDVSNTIMTIDNIPNLKRSEAPEYYYSNINIGYDKWETEFQNGLEEQNSKRQYNTGIKAVSNDLSIESELVASSYRLESSRRNTFSETLTTDSEYDEDNFLICLNRETTYDIPLNLDIAEKDENFDQVNNLISPETAYNLRISPARNLLRWSPVVNAGLLKYAGREIKFTSGEGNYKMTSELTDDDCPGRWNNNLFEEGQNVQWDDSDNSDNTPIWMPEILEFSYPLSMTEWQNIQDNSKGVFEVSDSDTGHIKAFILEVKFKPNDVSEFKLLKAYV